MAAVLIATPASAGEPPKRLVGFEKVHLQPGQKQRVELTIDPAAANHPLSVWVASWSGGGRRTGPSR